MLARFAVCLTVLLLTSSPPARAQPAPVPSQRYVMVVPISAHPFWRDIRRGGEDAARQLGVQFEFTGPVEFDNRGQQTQVEQIAATRPAAFLVGAYDPTMSDTIDRVTEMGIPVITFDSDAPRSKRISFIGPDDKQTGVDYTHKLVELIRARGVTSGKIGLLTAIDQANLQRRIVAIREYLAASEPGFVIAVTEDNRGDDQLAAERAKTMLTAHPDMAGILVVNATGSGVGTAIREMGMAGKVTVVAGGRLDPILCAIEAGTVQASGNVNTYIEGFLGVKLAFDVVNGNLRSVPGAAAGVPLLPPVIDPGRYFIDRSNATKLLERPCR